MRFHRHRWSAHPMFREFVMHDGRPLVRRCSRCGRTEHHAFLRTSYGLAGDHLQPKLSGWFRLVPFGLFLES